MLPEPLVELEPTDVPLEMISQHFVKERGEGDKHVLFRRKVGFEWTTVDCLGCSDLP